MFSRFFIDRPIFSVVIAIVIVLGGIMAALGLPVQQFPDVTPPTVRVSAVYPGASAEDVAEAVAAPLEQAINGVDNMLYMTSTTSDAGTLSINVAFEIGTDPDQAAINVNNRVQGAISKLPASVRRQGVTVEARSSSILLVGVMYAPSGRYDKIFISNYALVNVLDSLKRIEGVGSAQLFGSQDYSMRIWLNPQKLASYGLTTADVAAAIEAQNAQFAAGNFGAEPSPGTQPTFTYKATTTGRFSTPEQFADITLRSDADDGILRLGEVARIEIGAQSYSIDGTYNGQAAVPFAVYLSPGANALQVAQGVKSTMARLSDGFPDGLTYAIPFDTTVFVQTSIESVIHTLIEAMVLVVLLVFLFLQNFRATIIPLLAIPVSVIGTFLGLWLLGFSINLLTLFGLILAIGIVVDDAIIVIENVERIMTEEGKAPRVATIQAMREVGGPVVAVVLVLTAVFVPVGFLGGLSGQLYSQFALTIAVAVAISGLTALTLTPALCAAFLQPSKEPAWPFRKFNAGFAKLTRGYVRVTDILLRRIVLGLALFGILVAATWGLSTQVASTLVPEEDKGVAFATIALPPASALEQTNEIRDAFTQRALASMPAIDNITAFSGFDFLAGALQTNSAVAFISLKPWGKRDTSSFAVVRKLLGLGSTISQAQILAFNPPPIMGLSTTGGFTGFIQSLRGVDYDVLHQHVQEVLAAANQRPALQQVRTTLVTDVPRYFIDVNRDKALELGVSLPELFATLQATFGSFYVNDFTLLGRNFQVQLQSQYRFRAKPEDLRHVYVRSHSTGDMIPVSSLVDSERRTGASVVQRFNVFPAAKIMGVPAPGFSSGEAIAAMEDVVANVLGQDYNLAWTGTAYFEKRAGAKAMLAIGFGMVMVLLVLAALYERITLPLSVLSAVPFALFGGFLAVWLRGIEQSIYFQVGVLVLIGLAAKNAILIVEFAVLEREQGKSHREAALNAVRLRFRPIIMTSLAFILGVTPLALASGASAASQHAIGTVVIGGMLAATFLATLFVPLFYEIIEKASDRVTGRDRRSDAGKASASGGPSSDTGEDHYHG